MEYSEFLESKRVTDCDTGIVDVPELNSDLFPFQHDITAWALRRGRAAIFADCGMGKTPMQLEWAKHVSNYLQQRVLIVAPLAVSAQTIREGLKFNVEVSYAKNMDDVGGVGIYITNYERLHNFDPDEFGGIVIDESGILKSYTGKYRTKIVDDWRDVPFKLACTATPSPNDYMELGNHAEFVGAMTRTEMLSMFFVHDGGETQKWRLKGHAQEEFWKWVSSWAVMIRKPSDLGYDDGDFILPPLNMHDVVVDVDGPGDDTLFRMPASTLQERQKERKVTIADRVAAAAELVNSSPGEPWLIWCNLNDESAALSRCIDGAIEVKGSDKSEYKERMLLGFSAGEFNAMVSKPKIAGWGMNWQHCSNVVFVGLSDSYEQFYQAIRRCWRFGQTKPVNCYVITASTESVVVDNIKRKEADANRMATEMVKHMQVYNRDNIRGITKTEGTYMRDTQSGRGWEANLGDSCERIKDIESDSIGYTIFSPPFASLYTYSNSERDMGNCTDNEQFYKHFGEYLIPELLRITKPGRLLSFHCMNLPTSKTRDGYIGISDFRGELIRAFVDAGWIYHSEVCIWKDPVTAMQRTKALGLLHKQVVKDSCMSRQGIPDYLVTMRKPGDNPEPVTGELDYFCGDPATFQNNGRLSIDVWQKYASPVWDDIRPGNTLQKATAREQNDERHICPLQLDVIERGIQLWSNPDDIVFSPFMGIGSEGYVALKKERRFIGIELKKSYYDLAVKNLELAVKESTSMSLFYDAEED